MMLYVGDGLFLGAVACCGGYSGWAAKREGNRGKEQAQSKQYSLLILVISIAILILLRLLYRVQRGHSTLSTRQSSTTPFSIL